MKTIFVKPAEVARKWYIIDAQDQVLGRVAVRVASVLRGKNKPCYTPHQEIGDYVIVINADKMKLSGNKNKTKLYYRHSGYPGGLSVDTYETLSAKKPGAPLEKAIKGMLPKGPLGRKLFKNVKVYTGDRHPHAAQQPEVLNV
ncbi:50S ribosomal protein L13 [Spirochaeta cellobiosiphila]|uniref:50S ribosomal protein L13 n=1 Tax=Spirochaeta cellobiosiphila TaxID=504483 RepID=UPI0004089CAE|nr:50S ribosomal protein L13 [Spirochaeta cellobiosiphila]